MGIQMAMPILMVLLMVLAMDLPTVMLMAMVMVRVMAIHPVTCGNANGNGFANDNGDGMPFTL